MGDLIYSEEMIIIKLFSMVDFHFNGVLKFRRTLDIIRKGEQLSNEFDCLNTPGCLCHTVKEKNGSLHEMQIIKLSSAFYCISSSA